MKNPAAPATAKQLNYLAALTNGATYDALNKAQATLLITKAKATSKQLAAAGLPADKVARRTAATIADLYARLDANTVPPATTPDTDPPAPVPDHANARAAATTAALEAVNKLEEQFTDRLNRTIDTLNKRAAEQQAEFEKQLAAMQHARPITIELRKPDHTKVKVEGRQHKQLPELLNILQLRRPILLVGPAASGKTRAALEAAKAHDLPFYAQSNSPMDTPSDHFGHVTPNGDIVSKPFRDSFINGGVFLDDELDAANARVALKKNMLIDSRHGAFPDGMHTAHPNWIYVGSANTYGTGADRIYVGRNQLDGATINRFIQINWDYDEDLERGITVDSAAAWGLPASTANAWVDYVQAIRANVHKHLKRRVVSPRQSLMGAELLAVGITPKRAAEITIFPGWPTDEIQRATAGVNTPE